MSRPVRVVVILAALIALGALACFAIPGLILYTLRNLD